MSDQGPARSNSAPTNVTLLVICQALGNTVTAVMLATTALAGYYLAADKSLATLPHATQWVATMFMAIPAAMLMRRLGRKAAFIFGCLFGIAAGLICAYALFIKTFWMFVFGTFLIGGFNAFVQHFRFAAAEAADLEWRSRAISFVIGGGLIAAFAGPELAKLTKDLVVDREFTGTYLWMATIPIALAVVIAMVDFPAMAEEKKPGSGRPMSQIARRPVYIIAVLAGVTGWGSMVLLMTSTPIAIIVNGHQFNDAAFVIQWHIFAMFAPSFFSGWLVSRFGVLNVMLCGLVLAFSAVGTALSGLSVTHFWIANMMIGCGWNFLFVSGTSLLTEAYEPEERSKAQGVNDFVVFGSVSIFAFIAGYVQSNFGWYNVARAELPWLAFAAVAVLWFKLRHRRKLIS